jgi:hypothetical protein
MLEWMGIAALFLLLLMTIKLFEVGRSLAHIHAVVARMLTFLGEEAGRQRNEQAIDRFERREKDTR